MHEHYQQGWAFRRIARALNERGDPTRQGGQWYEKTVQTILADALAGRGSRRRRGTRIRREHGADRPARGLPEDPDGHGGAKGTSQAGRLPGVPLTGRHVRCGTCGGPMYCRQQHTGVLYFGCIGSHTGPVNAGWRCGPLAHSRDGAPATSSGCGDAQANQRGPRSGCGPGRPLGREVRRIESALGQLTSLYVDGDLLEGEYREARKLQMQRLLQDAEATGKRGAAIGDDRAL